MGVPNLVGGFIYYADNLGESGAAQQRSCVRHIELIFSEPVNLGSGAFVCQTQSGDPVGMAVQSNTPQTDGTAQVVLVPTDHLEFGSLQDGRYNLQVVAAEVASVSSGDQIAGDYSEDFLRLFGDSNGDGKVDSTDQTAFLGAYRSRRGMANYRSYFDFNDDGLVDSVDYYQFLRRNGNSI